MATNLTVHVFDNNIEGALKALKKGMLRTGLIKDMKRHVFRLQPSQARRLKSKMARAKIRKGASRRLAEEHNDEIQTPSRKDNAGRAGRSSARGSVTRFPHAGNVA